MNQVFNPECFAEIQSTSGGFTSAKTDAVVERPNAVTLAGLTDDTNNASGTRWSLRRGGHCGRMLRGDTY
jgi:hypothetical protein